jgi:hypothetical protein
VDTIYLESLKKTLGYLRLIGGNEAAISIIQKLIAKQPGVDRIAASCENKSG